jgi:hypothetical protein
MTAPVSSTHFRGLIRSGRLRSLLGPVIGLSLALLAGPQSVAQSGGTPPESPLGLKKVPEGVILVKGAWSSASDPVTPVPEGGKVTLGAYNSTYFGLTFPISNGWIQKYEGPPPSDSGYYVLAQLRPADSLRGAGRGTVLIGAQDMFFTQVPARNALDMVNFTKTHLKADYVVDQQPQEIEIAGHSFVRLDYTSPSAGLHWSMLATQIRCHTVQFSFMSADPKVIEHLVESMKDMKLPAQTGVTSGPGGDDAPLCINGYASGGNILERVEPIASERRYNSVPVRVIIGTNGKVRHIHFISAFPEQARAISDALQQWRFKPYLVNGKPVEVETGIFFGRVPRGTAVAQTSRPQPPQNRSAAP